MKRTHSLFQHSMKTHLVGLLVCMLACTGQAYKPSLARLIVLSAVMMDHTHITVEAGNVDSFPIISQFKSAVQAIGGDLEGAKRTQENFVDGCPVVSQVKAAVVAGTEGHEAARLQQEKFGKLMLDTIDGIPVAGHIKGAIHYAMGDNEMGEKCMVDATRGGVNLVAGAAGFMVGGPVGAGAATVLAGAAYDGIATGALTLAHGKVTPYGIVSAGMNLAEQAKTGRVDIGDAFDTAMGPVMDFAGTAVPLIKAKIPMGKTAAHVELAKLRLMNRDPLIEKPPTSLGSTRWADVQNHMPTTLESSLKNALRMEEIKGFKQFSGENYQQRFHLEAKMNDYFEKNSVFENYKKVNTELANRYLSDESYTRKLFLKDIERNLKRYDYGINEKMVNSERVGISNLGEGERVTGQSFGKWTIDDLAKADAPPEGSYFNTRFHRVQPDINYTPRGAKFADSDFILKSRMKTMNGDPDTRLVSRGTRNGEQNIDHVLLERAAKVCETCGEPAAIEHLNRKTPYFRDEMDPNGASSSTQHQHHQGGAIDEPDVVHTDPNGRPMNFDTVDYMVASGKDDVRPDVNIAKATCVDCMQTYAAHPDKVKFIPSNEIDKRVINAHDLPLDGKRPEGDVPTARAYDEIYRELPGTPEQKQLTMAAYAKMNRYYTRMFEFDKTAEKAMSRWKGPDILDTSKLESTTPPDRMEVIRRLVPETDMAAASQQFKSEYFSSGNRLKTSITMVEAGTKNGHALTVSSEARGAGIRNAAKYADIAEKQGSFQSMRQTQAALADKFARGELTEAQFKKALDANQKMYSSAISEKIAQYSHTFHKDTYVPRHELPDQRLGTWDHEDIVRPGRNGNLKIGETIPRENSLYNPKSHQLDYTVQNLLPKGRIAGRLSGLTAGQWATRSDYDHYHTGSHGFHHTGTGQHFGNSDDSHHDSQHPHS